MLEVLLYPCGFVLFYKIQLNSINFVITGDDRQMQVCNCSQAPLVDGAGYPGKLVPISAYIYFFMIEIILTAHSIIPAAHLWKTGISVLPYVFIPKVFNVTICLPFLPLYPNYRYLVAVNFLSVIALSIVILYSQMYYPTKQNHTSLNPLWSHTEQAANEQLADCISPSPILNRIHFV